MDNKAKDIKLEKDKQKLSQSKKEKVLKDS